MLPEIDLLASSEDVAFRSEREGEGVRWKLPLWDVPTGLSLYGVRRPPDGFASWVGRWTGLEYKKARSSSRSGE